MFEDLYDAAFDVTLPSLLWGINRDPDREFIIFNKFSKAKKMISILVEISNTFECNTRVDNQKSSSMLELKQLDVEYVSSLLEQLDQIG